MIRNSWSALSILLALIIALNLPSCGSFRGIDPEESVTETSLAGRSSKGPIFGGEVEIFSLEADGSMGKSIGKGVTDETGRYAIDLGSYTGAILVSLTGGKYRDEATGFIVENSLKLHAAVAHASGKVSAMVTPLTELAYRLAKTLTPEGIGEANSLVANITGIDILSCEPIDPLDLTEAVGATQEAKDYSLLLAAISHLSSQIHGVSTASDSPGGSISTVLDDLENDITDGKLDQMESKLLSGLITFIDSEQNNTGISDLSGTGLDEAITSGGASYSGVWYETGDKSGEFTISFNQTGDSFDGSLFVTSHTTPGENDTYLISGIRAEHSYHGTDSVGRDIIFEILDHPAKNAEKMLAGSYLDIAGGVRGAMRSTNGGAYNSIDGFVTIEGESDHSGAVVGLITDPSFNATTNEHGFYLLSGFPDGVSWLTASKEGYEPSESGPWEFADGSTHHGNANMTLAEIVLNPPSAETGPPSEVTTEGARVSGTVNPRGLPTEAWFEWGTSEASLTNRTKRQAAGSGDSFQEVTELLSGLKPGTTYYYRIAGENRAGTAAGRVNTFSTKKLPVPPDASTSPATAVTTSSAELNGTVNPNGFATEAWFEWGTGSALGNKTPAHGMGAGTSNKIFQQVLMDLQPGTTYFYRITAASSAGKTTGSILSFTAKEPAAPPGASTGQATSISTDAAKLNGMVSPNGSATEAWFEWGTGSSSMPNITTKQGVGSGSSPTPVASTLSGLEPGTTYFFRIAAASGGGMMKGSTESFTTDSLPVPPATKTTPATSVDTGSAVINGTVNPNGFATEAWFEWGTSSSSLSQKTPRQDTGSGTSATALRANLSGLDPGTAYFFRIAAANVAGTMKGDTLSFTTPFPLTPPGAATYPATWITTTGANLNGKVNPNGFATETWFEWGTSSSSLSNKSAKQSMGSGTVSRDVQHTLSGLGQGQTYYYRIVAASQAGTMKGTVEEFTTDTSDVTLRWQPPTTNVDGSAVDDLAGYRVYYGMSSRNYSHVIDVGNVTSYTVENLPTGKFYFALTSYDTAGNESGFSAEGYKYIE